MKTYVIIHRFDTDGGFGDAISEEERICSFEKKEDAEKFITKYGNDHIYDCPYVSLHCGELVIEEEETITFEEAEKLVENAWWREKKGE